MRRRCTERVWFVLLLGGALACAEARACSVPVFRYALERWANDPYEVYVFHRGPLSESAEKVVAQLKHDARSSSPDAYANVTTVDLAAGDVDEATAAIWKPHAGATLPWIVVRYPHPFGVPIDAWAGPLEAAPAHAVFDSPTRRQVARRILEGDSAVFVLLESGDRQRDEAATHLLEAELDRLEKILKPPAPANGSWGDPVYDQGGAPDLKIAFSLVRLSRSDPAEQPFISMLLGCEPDLHEITDPMVFPLFGRGRALCALAGKGINKENLEEIGFFLGGPCSCVVKYQSPGVDMLMQVDWVAALDGQTSAIPEIETPPLEGLSAFVPAGEGEAPVDPAAGERASLLQGILVATGLGVLILAVAAALVWRRVR